MPIATGTRLGPYEILGPLGAGGMGEVYRARDARLSRDVAVKVIPAAFAADPERLRRFEQEARAVGMLNHPNILAVYDIGTHEGSPYLVTELLEGATLRETGTPPQRKALDYAQQIAHGLAAAATASPSTFATGSCRSGFSKCTWPPAAGTSRKNCGRPILREWTELGRSCLRPTARRTPIPSFAGSRTSTWWRD